MIMIKIRWPLQPHPPDNNDDYDQGGYDKHNEDGDDHEDEDYDENCDDADHYADHDDKDAPLLLENLRPVWSQSLLVVRFRVGRS